MHERAYHPASAVERVRRADERVRRQVERLEALWRVVTEPSAGGRAMVEAKLREARTALRFDQPFRAILSRIDGTEFVVLR